MSNLKVLVALHDYHMWEADRGDYHIVHQLPGREDHYFGNEAMILAADATHVLVTPQEETWVFSVELETMEVERAKERNRYAGPRTGASCRGHRP